MADLSIADEIEFESLPERIKEIALQYLIDRHEDAVEEAYEQGFASGFERGRKIRDNTKA